MKLPSAGTAASACFFIRRLKTAVPTMVASAAPAASLRIISGLLPGGTSFQLPLQALPVADRGEALDQSGALGVAADEHAGPAALHAGDDDLAGALGRHDQEL